MISKPGILIVDDEPLLLDYLELQLLRLNQKVVARAESYDLAIAEAHRTQPDIAILDINLLHEKDGIDLAFELNQIKPMAIIFLTSLQDDEIFQRARAADPLLYLIKPINTDLLKLNLELVWNRFLLSRTSDSTEEVTGPVPSNLSTQPIDFWFVKERGILTKINIADIDYLEADTKYTLIYTPTRKWAIRQSLKELAKKIPTHYVGDFVQIHRSYFVNLNKVDRILPSEMTITVRNNDLPIGALYKESLLKRLTLLS